jgi:hypothetical protein
LRPEVDNARPEAALRQSADTEGKKESFHTFTQAQNMLVDDLSMRRWVRLRNLRCQTAPISSEIEQLEITCEDLEKQYDRDGMSFNRAEVEEKGLANMPDCRFYISAECRAGGRRSCAANFFTP